MDDETVTEDNWQQFVGYPDDLFDAFPDQCVRTQRKLILYTCATCQRVRKLFPTEALRTVIDWAEDQAGNAEREGVTCGEPLHIDEVDWLARRYPDGSVAKEVTWSLYYLILMVWGDTDWGSHKVVPEAMEHAFWLNHYPSPESFRVPFEELPPLVKQERIAHCHLLRDVFGNPFRPVQLDPEWRTPTVVALAQQLYESRDLSAMPILADALQDAGCDNNDILNHCREVNGVHVRGCWVVDMILGKE